MCDFHSIIGVQIGNDISIVHLPSNSHSEMEKEAGVTNKPNRKTLLFEAEWGGDGEIPDNRKLIRNIGEASEKMVARIRMHYKKLKETLSNGKHFGKGGYFSDAEKWRDVWEVAMQRGSVPDFSMVRSFSGSVYVKQGATFTAPVLAKAGSVYVEQGATLTAPVLAKAGSVYVKQGATLTAPKLKK